MKIGIIGFGFVGQAVAWAHKHQQVIINDPKLPDSISLSQFIDCDAIFVCVPSPPVDVTLENGRCDSSILENTLKGLSEVVTNKNIPIICKTTAPPKVYEKLHKQYSNIVHCPEFLTAANNIADYINSKFFILGGHREYCERAKDIIQTGISTLTEKFLFTSIKTASLYKYMMNCYLATKVTFMNDFYQLAEAEGVEWNNIIELSTQDSRIGNTHLMVPGSNGQYGWAGACFPKDIAAIITEAVDSGLDFELMQRVESINKKHRKLND